MKRGKWLVLATANGLHSVQEIQLTAISTGKWQSMGNISVRCSLLDNYPTVDHPVILYSS